VGINSLKSLNRFISDKEVYEKQQKNYNIISVQPREYQDTIRMFPNYRLENEDHNYYKKMQLEKEFATKYQTRKQQAIKLPAINPESSARPVREKYLNQ